MEKTTIETMKSVIQDWLGQCETPEELGRTYAGIRAELELTFSEDMQIKTATAPNTYPAYPPFTNPCHQWGDGSSTCTTRADGGDYDNSGTTQRGAVIFTGGNQ